MAFAQGTGGSVSGLITASGGQHNARILGWRGEFSKSLTDTSAYVDGSTGGNSFATYTTDGLIRGRGSVVAIWDTAENADIFNLGTSAELTLISDSATSSKVVGNAIVINIRFIHARAGSPPMVTFQFFMTGAFTATI